MRNNNMRKNNRRISNLKNKKGIKYGCWVRFHENKKCILFKRFPKKEYGGSLKKALIKARKWRDQQEKIFNDEKKLKETSQYYQWRLEVSNKLGYEVEIIHFTKEALFVYNGSEDKKWLPLSEIEVIDGEVEKGEKVIIQMPEWLAVEKGFE